MSENPRCHYCNCLTYPRSSGNSTVFPSQLRTRDHKRPICILTSMEKGGPDNVVTACQRCNSAKHDTPYEVFSFWLKLHGFTNDLVSDKREYRQFCFDLMRAGLRAALARCDSEAA